MIINMRVALLLGFFLISTFVFAQTSVIADTVFNQTDHLNQKQGYWKKFYKNGKVAYQGFFKDDKPRGLFLRFHENGVVSARMTFSTCGDTASAILYNTLRREVAKGKYLNTKKHSVWNYFAPDGRLVFTEEFNEGAKNGRFLTYYPNGQVYEQVTWRNNEKNGPTLQYYPDGSIKSTIFYKNGIEQGIIKTYYFGGQERLDGAYENGLKHGRWTLFSAEGEVVNVIIYEMGIAKNHDELVEKETREFEKMLKNVGKIQEPSIEEFLRGTGF
jgi:antitoxin component YwqK of YwqJK toxin-antitoxin module